MNIKIVFLDGSVVRNMKSSQKGATCFLKGEENIIKGIIKTGKTLHGCAFLNEGESSPGFILTSKEQNETPDMFLMRIYPQSNNPMDKISLAYSQLIDSRHSFPVTNTYIKEKLDSHGTYGVMQSCERIRNSLGKQIVENIKGSQKLTIINDEHVRNADNYIKGFGSKENFNEALIYGKEMTDTMYNSGLMLNELCRNYSTREDTYRKYKKTYEKLIEMRKQGVIIKGSPLDTNLRRIEKVLSADKYDDFHDI